MNNVLVSFRYHGRLYERTIRSHQAANAPARLFHKYPELDQKKVQIINCLSTGKASMFERHSLDFPNHKNK